MLSQIVRGWDSFVLGLHHCDGLNGSAAGEVSNLNANIEAF